MLRCRTPSQQILNALNVFCNIEHIAWTAKQFSCDLFVPHCDSFPMNREKKIAVHVICLFRSAIHFPWTEKKRSQFTRFVCSALRFISHEPRKKDTHSLYLHCLQQRPLLKFSEQSKKFEFPVEIGHLTLFQDKTILAYSFRQNSAGSCRRFCRLFIDKLIKTTALLVYHYIY